MQILDTTKGAESDLGENRRFWGVRRSLNGLEPNKPLDDQFPRLFA